MVTNARDYIERERIPKERIYLLTRKFTKDDLTEVEEDRLDFLDERMEYYYPPVDENGLERIDYMYGKIKEMAELVEEISLEYEE